MLVVVDGGYVRPEFLAGTKCPLVFLTVLRGYDAK
jgi:hypothetical protein